MFVLNLTENLLHDVLKRHYPACSSELVHNHSEALLLLKEDTHEPACRHGLRHERHFVYAVLPAVRIAEHLRTVHIAHYMVYVPVIGNDFRVAALDELHKQRFVSVAVYIHRVYFGTWHHAVAHLDVRELQGIMEYLHFLVYVVLTSGIFNARLHKIVEVYLRKAFVVVFLPHPYSGEAEHCLGQERGETAYRP